MTMSRSSSRSMEEGRNSIESFSCESPTDLDANRPRFHPSVYILVWIFFSNITIIFNKWLIDTAGFRYPILLTAWHLVFSTVATQILAQTTSLLDSRHELPLTRRLYTRTILPIGFLYSGSLVFSNIVYLYLSVAFIQMLKAAGPVAVLFTSWAWGVATPSWSTLGNILIIVAGVAIASAGEVQFSLIGFLFQLAGIVFEAVRVIMIQVMLGGEGLRMDPLVGLYYYAPVCAFMNIVVGLIAEGGHFQWEDVAKAGYGMLFLNAFVAFFLNIASVFLIGKTSGLVMSLSGILKSILLVVASVMIWQTKVTIMQALGYVIALVGLILYSTSYEQLRQGWLDVKAWTTGTMRWQSLGEKGQSSAARKGLIIGGVALVMTIVVLGICHANGITVDQVLKLTGSIFGSS